MNFARIRFRGFLTGLEIKRLTPVGMLAFVCLIAGCGGGSAQSSAVAVAVAVTVSPNPATVFLGATQAFVATVTATNMAVTWTVQEGSAGGSITSAGVYTAPQVVGTYHVIATSQADTTKSATVTITVPAVAVAIYPATDTLGPSGTRTFVAIVSGAFDTAVTWSVQERAAGGTIDAHGNYIAPGAQGTFHVVASLRTLRKAPQQPSPLCNPASSPPGA